MRPQSPCYRHPSHDRRQLIASQRHKSLMQKQKKENERKKKENSRRFKGFKQWFVSQRRASPLISLMKFVDTITTPDIDEHRRQSDKHDKHLKASGNGRLLPGTAGPDGVVGSENDEDEQGDNLKGETGEGDVDTVYRIRIRGR